MEILSEEEMEARLDFARPLKEAPEERESAWCIPFEYGGNRKGTRISVAKAKEIAAELRAAVAEAESRQLLLAFKREQERGNSLGAQLSEAQRKLFESERRASELERRLRAKRRRR